MIGPFRVASACLALVLMAQARPAPPAGGGNPRVHALLIGVTDWMTPSAISVTELEGPANDVTLFRREVLTRFGVPDSRITTLAGLPSNPAQRPTRANIEREFVRLASTVTKGDQVVILMAGHGSQQPANNDPADDEPDGFDEIFLPADIGPWDGTAHTVRNAIVDDDIRRWLLAIRNTGASVWIVFDSCFSGTMTRGAPETLERERQAEMSDLGVPRAAIDAASRRAVQRQGQAKSVLGLTDGAGALTAMYATGTDEKTIERSFGPNAPVQGLFTLEIVQAIDQSLTPLTYRELARLVQDRYRSRQRFASTPTFEGGGIDTEVLGHRTWPDRPTIRIMGPARPSGWQVDAGLIRGLTPGSVLELFPPAGAPSGDVRVGHLRVIDATPTTARVEPIAFASMTAPAASVVINASRARVALHGPGDLRLRVGLQPGTAVGPNLQSGLTSLLERTNGLAEYVATGAADWYLRVDADAVILMPAGGWQPASAPYLSCDPADPSKRLDSGPAAILRRRFVIGRPGGADIGDRLAEVFERISKAANLSRMATSRGGALNVELAVTRLDSERAVSGRPLQTGSGAARVLEDEWLELSVTNASDRSVDVTLLYTDAGFGITPVFPTADAAMDNRLAPGGSTKLRIQLSGCPLGWESAVLIAVESNGPRQDFSVLAQPRVEATSRGNAQAPSALQALLDAAAFGRGAETRGPPQPRALPPHVVRVVSWRTEGR